ncbi:MAG: TlpA family protein disulfide reductase, partial [Odoribacteraceae bacterium]|nr:TlpA family protein disulfide reductase [Odoribacteraceae bacterium]
MKRTNIITGAIIITALCVVFTTTCNRNESVFVNPEYDSSDADYFSLHKIERTDTATIVYADVYHLPNYWVLISSGIKLKDSKNKTYKLLACRGFETDKKVFMPATGSMSFALYFEPVDKREKIVDIIDMDENGATITGIKLYNVKHDEPVQCLLKGEVINRPQSSRLVLLTDVEDFRTAKVTYISIHDGKFEYPLYTNAEETWQLIFYDEIQQGTWRSVNFIAESGTCYFTLNNENEWENNSIRGGKYTEIYRSIPDSLGKTLNVHYKPFNEKRDKLHEENKYYTPEANRILEEVRGLPRDAPNQNALWQQFYELENEGKLKTMEAIDLEKETSRIYKTMYADKLMDYAREHADIVGYSFLVKNIRNTIEQNRDQLDVKEMFAVFHDAYEKKYPDHPYTSVIRSYIQAADIKVGNPCPDFVTEDSEGKEVHLSGLIKDKVALVHLWASWCGPCRRHGKEMIPIYEMYKDKGFTIVGVAREQKKESMFSAIEKDKYPWQNFIELNDKNGIWIKFGISNAGGGDFL